MRLTKTQRALLERAARNHYGRTSVVSGYITSRRNGSYGRRESEAACKLVEAGLFEYLGAERSVRHLCHRYGADRGHDTSYRITEAGRREIER